MKKAFKGNARVGNELHIEIANGTPEQNYLYITKCGKATELGEMETHQGQRNDIKKLRMAIMEQKDEHELAESELGDTMMRIPHGFKMMYGLLHKQPRRPNPYVICLFGMSGAGKTYEAINKYSVGEPYQYTSGSNGNNKWWPGYISTVHKTVIINEACGGFAQLHYTLQFLDPLQPVVVEGKNTTDNMMAERVIFTSNSSPWSWYSEGPTVTRMHKIAFIRRFQEIIYYEGTFKDKNVEKTQLVPSNQGIQEIIKSLEECDARIALLASTYTGSV